MSQHIIFTSVGGGLILSGRDARMKASPTIPTVSNSLCIFNLILFNLKFFLFTFNLKIIYFISFLPPSSAYWILYYRPYTPQF
jgi:hypothetical protein